MELGVHFMNFSGLGGNTQLSPRLAATAQAADEAGFTLLTMMDHWFQMEAFAPPTEPMLEGYTSLGFVAGKTKRITLGLMVTGVTYRHPGLLAKIVTTLDVLSEGRAMFGVGAAWYKRDDEGLGVANPPSEDPHRRRWGEEDAQAPRPIWRCVQPVRGRRRRGQGKAGCAQGALRS